MEKKPEFVWNEKEYTYSAEQSTQITTTNIFKRIWKRIVACWWIIIGLPYVFYVNGNDPYNHRVEKITHVWHMKRPKKRKETTK